MCKGRENKQKKHQEEEFTLPEKRQCCAVMEKYARLVTNAREASTRTNY